jgi:two-component system chemotaxis response regulator CheY
MSQSSLIDLSHISVMCVDDDPVIRSVIRFALERHGCPDVVQAHGGGEALDLCAGRNFDLVICDFQMSPVNGLDFLRELAKSGIGEGWPVIMLSAETNPATIQEAQDLGVRAWVAKPVSAQTLIEQIGGVLRLSGQNAHARHDPESRGVTERHHAHLMVALKTAEEAVHSLNLRPREAVLLAQSLRHALDDIHEHARTLGYGLATLLAARSSELVMAMVRNPGAAARANNATARALGTLITAMKRVAHNRMEGDGGEAGLKLLSMIDGIVAPVRAALALSRQGADRRAAS